MGTIHPHPRASLLHKSQPGVPNAPEPAAHLPGRAAARPSPTCISSPAASRWIRWRTGRSAPRAAPGSGRPWPLPGICCACRGWGCWHSAGSAGPPRSGSLCCARSTQRRPAWCPAVRAGRLPSLPGAQPLFPGALRSVRGEDNGEGFPQERADPGGEGSQQTPRARSQRRCSPVQGLKANLGTSRCCPLPPAPSWTRRPRGSPPSVADAAGGSVPWGASLRPSCVGERAACPPWGRCPGHLVARALRCAAAPRHRPPGAPRLPRPSRGRGGGREQRQQPKFRRQTLRSRALLLTSAKHHSANMTAAGLDRETQLISAPGHQYLMSFRKQTNPGRAGGEAET